MIEGEFREVKVGDGEQDKVLISKFDGKLWATGAFCTHLGAPFAPNGGLFDDKIMCSYHAATYSVVTGVAENAPGRDGLETYKVVQEDGKWYVVVPEELKKDVMLPMANRDLNDKRNFVIVGAGAAGLNCAETLRYSGYTGKITMINGEKTLPLERTLLTKTLPFGDYKNYILRNEEFFKNADIDVISDQVYSIHTDIKKVTLERGQPIEYDKLLIATGTQTRKSTIPGSDAKHVYYLRTGHDQEQIKEWAKNGVKRGVAIIGGGFVSTEVASSLILHYKDKFDVHVISSQETPLEHVFGKRVGEALANKHRTHGV